MKKLFTLFLTAVFSLNICAAITNLTVDVDGTNADFYWKGDTSLSKIYELDLLEGSSYGYICAGAWYATVFDMGQDGWMWMSSDLMLAYGQNYASIEAAGAPATTVEAWKTNWEASVDTVGTKLILKPGSYVILIVGYDDAYNQKTESMSYAFFNIVNSAEDIITPNSKERFIKQTYNGNIILVSDENIYDIFGRKIQ